jgi:hypothetical protein
VEAQLSSQRPYVYRGTSVGWPGNAVCQRLPITCTSSDPLVAALFGVYCLNHGPGVVYAATRSNVEQFVTAPNQHAHDWERAVNLGITPLEFIRYAIIAEPVEVVREILTDIGFAVPTRIRDLEALNTSIRAVFESSGYLSEAQLAEFDARLRRT